MLFWNFLEFGAFFPLVVDFLSHVYKSENVGMMMACLRDDYTVGISPRLNTKDPLFISAVIDMKEVVSYDTIAWALK